MLATYHKVSLFDVFFMIRLHREFWGKYQRSNVPFSLHYMRYLMSILVGGINLGSCD